MFKQRIIVHKKNLTNAPLHHIALVGLSACLIALCAQINIPLKPVPITLHTVGIMLLAVTCQRTIALQAILLYLALGAIGVPVFSGFSGGPHVFLGPTGGYLLGFVVSVATMTTLRTLLDDKNFLHVILNCLLGTVIIIAFGVGRLGMLIGLKSAINNGLLPFILPALLKIMLVASLVTLFRINFWKNVR